MKLKLIFLGDDPKPIGPVIQLFNAIEYRLFELEKSRIFSLPKEFPEISERLAINCVQRLDTEYKSGTLSMLHLESVRPGCLIFLAVMSSVGTWVFLNTIGEDFKTAYQKTDLSKRVKLFFLMGQKDVLEKAVEDVAADYKRREERRQSDGHGNHVNIQSITVNKSNPDQHTLDVRIALSRVNGFQTYAELADDLNKGK